MADHWMSYDTAAAAHDRIGVPSQFEAPARDLVATIDLGSAARILDIGTGSGVAARRAASVAGPRASVVGIDPSLAMLRIARGHGLQQIAVAAVPDLPFAERVFDRVLASFVMSHVSSYEAALGDIVRVMRPGGRFGATSWGSLENDYRQLWDSLAESFIGKERLADAIKKALPWEEWFTEPEHWKEALQSAGLEEIEVHREVYTVAMSMADFLSVRENSLSARFIRGSVGAPEWERFKATVADEFHRRFKDPLDHERDVLIAVGKRR